MTAPVVHGILDCVTPTVLETPVWRSEQLRLTAMPSTFQPTAIVRDWWPAVVGTSPDEFREAPRTGTLSMVGSFAGERLEMYWDRQRAEILFGASDGPDPEALPPLDDMLQPFATLAARWLSLPTRPAVLRLGSGINAIQVFPEIEDCRAALDSYLSAVDMRKSEPVSFQYRTNRPTSSAHGGLKLNRIGSWSADPLLVPNGEPRHGIRLVTDVNTAFDENDRRILDIDLVELFGELTGLCIRLVGEGDRP